jgi:uncharacterized protein (TIGR03437 family)
MILLLFLCLTTAAAAAPTLRLAGADLRPVWIQQGSSGPTNVLFEAYNIGDGALNVQARGSHPWLQPAVEAARPCSFDASKSCRPVRLGFNTGSLAPGAYRALVTVSDPEAVDAPQSVRLTVYVNGNVPQRLDFYLPPEAGASESVMIQTPGGPPPALRATTQSGGNWLAVSTSGLGSFQFLYTHRVTATVQSGMAAGDFNGSVAISNSSFAGDNRAVPATLHVTESPIARPATSLLQFRGVQGGAALEVPLAVANGGRGTLTLSGATASGGAWLTASVQEGVLRVRAEPGSLAPGFYDGAVSIASDAANNPVSVAVQLEVQAAGAPLADFGGVVDAASFDTPVSGGALVSLFGSQLATGVAQAASIPLPTALSGTSVLVNNVAAPLIFVSPGQINFQMPWDVSGAPQVRVERQGQRGNAVSVTLARRAPGIFGLPGTTYGIAVNASRGNAFALPDIPAFASIPKAAARPGDVLVLYGSGFGPVNPAVASGAAAGAEPLSRVTDTPRVSFGRGIAGPFADPLFAGLTPGFVGLYQINVQVPASVPANARTPVRLDIGNVASNIVEIAVER